MDHATHILLMMAVKAKNDAHSVAKKAECKVHLAAEKLREKTGFSTFVEMLILVVGAVVIGGIVLGLGGDTIKEVWQTLATRIKDLFNYT